MTTDTLPIIDISPYLVKDPGVNGSIPRSASGHDTNFAWPPTPQQRACSAAIHQACLDHGFFYLANLASVLPPDDFTSILDTAKAFFDLPQPVKDRLSINDGPHNGSDGARGYQRIMENVTLNKKDFHEGLDFYKPVAVQDEGRTSTSDGNLPLHGHNQWPTEEELPGFRTRVESWMDMCLLIGQALVIATAVGLGMDKDEVENMIGMVNDSFWVMRCIGYPPLPESHDGVSCGAHKDYGCYTLLHSTSQPGSLQVFNTTTKEWMEVSPIKDSFIVNIGEMWETWTNGLYKSTLHRVVHKTQSYRVSIPFFFEPNWSAEVRPLDAALRLQEEMDLPTQPMKQSVVYGDFLTKKVAGNFSKDGQGSGSRY